jgi:hypothetical protein
LLRYEIYFVKNEGLPFIFVYFAIYCCGHTSFHILFSQKMVLFIYGFFLGGEGSSLVLWMVQSKV